MNNPTRTSQNQTETLGLRNKSFQQKILLFTSETFHSETKIVIILWARTWLLGYGTLIATAAITDSKVHLYLIGFMGAGKTTVGKLLAEQLTRPFVDLDDFIEKQAALSIPMIFEQFGEHYFRQLETDCLRRVARYPNHVVATGGGIVLSAENRDLMKQTGITVYLRWPIEILFQRIQNSSNRPLIKSVKESSLMGHIEKMLSQRQSLYEQADLVINGEASTTEVEIVASIAQQLPSTFGCYK